MSKMMFIHTFRERFNAKDAEAQRSKEKTLHNLISATILIKLSNRMVRIDRIISKKYILSILLFFPLCVFASLRLCVESFQQRVVSRGFVKKFNAETQRRKGAKKNILKISFLILLIFLPFTCFCNPFGKDADLVNLKIDAPEPPCRPCAGGIGVSLSQALIRFHQEVVTPIDGPRSHFRPSSSQYTLDAIEKYGFFTGWAYGCDRLMRENDDPWIYPKRLNENGELYKWNPVR
jgi:hypothetical protein